MKKFMKISCLVLMLVLAFTSFAFATDIEVGTFDGGELGAVVGNILGVIQWVGIIIAFVMIIVVGIQYVLANPGKKAELKDKMWSMAIGIVLVIGGVTIVKYFIDAAGTIAS